MAAKKQSKSGNVTKPKIIGFGRALRNFFAGYFNFRGTATRAELWWMILFWGVVAAAFVLFIIRVQPLPKFLEISIIVAALILRLSLIVPAFALFVRRIHDTGFSAWTYFGPWVAAYGVKILAGLWGILVDEGVIFYILCIIYAAISVVVVGLWLFFALKPGKSKGNKYRIK